jgi:hypothetical protein
MLPLSRLAYAVTDRPSNPGSILHFVNQDSAVIRCPDDSFIVQTAIKFSGVYHTGKKSVN